MKLREKLKNTLLIDKKTKEKLLSMNTWPKEIENLLEKLFIKYGKIENKLLEDIYKNTSQLYEKTIKDIEKLEKEKEIKELKEIENKLRSL